MAEGKSAAGSCPVAHSYPFSSPHALDLDPTYARLRAAEPLARVRLPYGQDGWLVTRYADARTVLADSRFSREAVVGVDIPRVRPELTDQPGSLLSLDPPAHGRLRRLVANAFTKRRVDTLRPRMERIANDLLDQMSAAGRPADFVRHVSVPLAVTTISELFGIPEAGRRRFRVGAEAALSTSAMSPEQRRSYRADLNDYLVELVEQRRREPADDLLGTLVTAHDERDRLSKVELVQLAWVVLVAGYDTTMNQIGNMVWTLLSEPDRWNTVRREPNRLAARIEELLRFIPLGVAAAFPRIATEDVELSGVTIRAGDAVLLLVHAANRDPDVFADPEVLDLDREPAAHLAFGHGPHHCIGAQLARMELEVLLSTMARRFGGLELAVAADDVPWRTGGMFRGPRELLVTW
jgi:cytochrome P450